MKRLAALLGLCAALVACQTTDREVISTADSYGESCCSTNASSCCDMAACGCECCGGDDSLENCSQAMAAASCCSVTAMASPGSSCCATEACGCSCCGGDSDEGCEQMAAMVGTSTCCSAQDE